MKKRTFQILKIIIALAAYGYIAWKIYDYRLHAYNFFLNYRLDVLKISLILITFLLMPINWLIEAIKWRKLVDNFTKINLKHSFKAVLVGISTGIFTPNRIGEFAGRPYFTDNTKITSGVFAGFAGSLAQSMVTVFSGIIALNFYLFSGQIVFISKISYFFEVLVFSILFILILIYIFFHLEKLIKLKRYIRFFKKYENELLFLKKYASHDLFLVLFYSLLRYLTFFIQYFLLLRAFEVNIQLIDAFVSVASVYLFLFAIPALAFSEIGIRSSLAVFFIGMYSANLSGIFAASILLWFINLAIPAVLGTLVLLSSKE